MPLCLVGTSGWSYGWNPDGLEWYARHSGLDAVEVNSTFYRLPPRRLVERWASIGRQLSWSVKISRRISHVHRLNEKALEYWRVFQERLSPLDSLIDFYLLQLPPSFDARPLHEERLRVFARETGLGPRLAVEYRHPTWWGPGEPGRKLAVEEGFTLVSVDAPEPIGTVMWRSGPRAYLRLHGRSGWYSHYYREDELREIASMLLSLGCEENHVFFNNDHAMLKNARAMKTILLGLGCRGSGGESSEEPQP